MSDATRLESQADKFTVDPSAASVTQCLLCARFVYGPLGAGCRPFPGGVPDEILTNAFDHRRPHPDENEPVRFEPRPDAPGPALASLYRNLDALPRD